MTGHRPPLLAALIGPELAGHVATALLGYRRALAAVGRPAPPGMDVLLTDLAVAVRNGQPRDGSLLPGDAQPVMLTTTETADALRVSARTLRRRLADGSVASVMVGGRRLVPASVVLELVERAA